MKKKCGIFSLFIVFIYLLCNFTFLCVYADNMIVEEIFISSDGADSNPGTFDAPLKSITAGIAKAKGKKVQFGNEKGEIRIILRGGDYRLTDAIALTQADSGNENLTFVLKGADGEKVRITHDTSIDNSLFEKVTDADILSRIDETAREKIYQLDMKKLGVTEYGDPIKKKYSSWVKSGFELYYNENQMQYARWPNNEFAYTGVLDTEYQTGAAFGITDERISRWTTADQALVHGYWMYGWANDALKVTKIDSEKKMIYTSDTPTFGITNDRKFFIYNLLEELDEPGEYFLDRKTGILYIYPTDEDIKKAAISYSTNQNDIITTDGTSYWRFENISFEKNCASAFIMKNGSHINIKNCTVSNVVLFGVRASAVSDSSITGCEMYNMANDVIDVSVGDKPTLTPGNFNIEDNHIYHWGVYARAYAAAVTVDGVGNRIANNCIHDSTHMAIAMRGNDMIIENNEFFDVLQETDDAGVLYCGRNWVHRGNVIRNNYFHDIHSGAGCMGVYLDDTFCGASVYNNIFYNIPTPVMIGGGSDNEFKNNLIIDKPVKAGAPIIADARGTEAWFAAGSSQAAATLSTVPYKNDIWKEKYPNLYNIDNEDPLLPKRNVITDNIISNHNTLNINPKVKELGTVENNYETQEKIKIHTNETGQPVIDNPEVFKSFPTFTPIDTEKIGLSGNGAYTQPDRTVKIVADSEVQKLLHKRVNVENLDIKDMLIDDGKTWISDGKAAQFSNGALVLNSGLTGYTTEQFLDFNFRFKAEFEKGYGAEGDPSGSFLGIMVRSGAYDQLAWSGISNYYVIIKPTTIELHRYMAGGEMVRNVENIFPMDKPYNIEFTASNQSDGKYVIIRLRINGVYVFNFVDDSHAINNKKGYIVFHNTVADKKILISEYDTSAETDENPYNLYFNDDEETEEESQKEETAVTEEVPDGKTATRGLYNLTVSGEKLASDIEPQLIENRLMVPLRAIFEYYGYSTGWDDNEKAVVLSKGETRISMKAGSPIAYVDKTEYSLDAPIAIVDGRMLVPLRFISESLAVDIKWDFKTSTVNIE